MVALTQAALPLLRRSGNPVVVNVSSGLVSFALVTDLHGDLCALSPQAGAVARWAAVDLDAPTGTFQSAQGEVPW